MRSGSRPSSTGSPTSWPKKATEVRRSKAIGIIAQPAEALRLLCQHQDDDWDGSAEPADRDLEPADSEPDHDQQPSSPPADPDLDAEPASDGDQEHRSLQIIPPPFDPKKARPRVVVYVHLSEEALRAGTGIARVEEVGPVLLGRLHGLLGDHCNINLKPVIDLPAGHIPVDSYEIPASLREHLLLRYPADMFPYAARVSRQIDIDHTIAYLSPAEGGPPGQTRIGNLGPFTRGHHNQKTHGRWQVRQPERGTWLRRSPHHRIYLVNATGTHPLGNTDFAQAIWRAAESPMPALTN
jgi:hypothetical protein